MPEKDKFVIWPIYFDSTRSRSEGRAVSAEDAVSLPTIDDVITAALKAGLKPEIERDKKHPSTWHESSGRILVQKSGSKSAVLRRISASLRLRGKKKRK